MLIREVEVAGPRDALVSAADEFRKGLTPPRSRDVEGWLAELSVIVARRADDEFTETLRLRAYTSRLMAYPADVVHEALCVVTWHFWPAWDELKQVCDKLAGRRIAILRKIEAEIERDPEPEREAVGPEDMQARREAADAILAELGFKSRVGGVETNSAHHQHLTRD